MLAIIGRKIGMTHLFDADGMRVPLTVVQVQPNVVVRERTSEANGYSALVLGAEALKKSRTRKPYAGQFPAGIEATRVLLEFRDFDRECKVGDKLGVEIFEGVKFVDVRGTTKGKGFQGVVRRHGFRGNRRLPQDHQGLADAGEDGKRPPHSPEPPPVPRRHREGAAPHPGRRSRPPRRHGRRDHGGEEVGRDRL